MTRPDDPEKMNLHAGRYAGGKALIVLGGTSGSDWDILKDEIKPDVILIGNGVNSMIRNADYWMCAENMHRTFCKAQEGEQRYIDIMAMFYRDAGAKTKLISHRSWDLLKDTRNCIRIMRDKNHGSGPGETPDYFSFRKYGGGFLNGWLLKATRVGALVHTGTVGLHLIHLAGILGCSEVHTIGYDLCFKNDNSHHWYPYPVYGIDGFRKEAMFTEYKGLKTQLVWIETMQFLKEIQPLFVRDGLKWQDHSHGLLEMEGIAQ